jgi:hypothetical protein
MWKKCVRLYSQLIMPEIESTARQIDSLGYGLSSLTAERLRW